MFSLLWNMIHRREIITLTSDNRHIPDKTSGFQHALYEVDLSTPLTQSNDSDGNPDGHCPNAYYWLYRRNGRTFSSLI